MVVLSGTLVSASPSVEDRQDFDAVVGKLEKLKQQCIIRYLVSDEIQTDSNPSDVRQFEFALQRVDAGWLCTREELDSQGQHANRLSKNCLACNLFPGYPLASLQRLSDGSQAMTLHSSASPGAVVSADVGWADKYLAALGFNAEEGGSVWKNVNFDRCNVTSVAEGTIQLKRFAWNSAFGEFIADFDCVRKLLVRLSIRKSSSHKLGQGILSKPSEAIEEDPLSDDFVEWKLSDYRESEYGLIPFSISYQGKSRTRSGVVTTVASELLVRQVGDSAKVPAEDILSPDAVPDGTPVLLAAEVSGVRYEWRDNVVRVMANEKKIKMLNQLAEASPPIREVNRGLWIGAMVATIGVLAGLAMVVRRKT